MKDFCREILTQLNGKPVSFEVFADDYSEMKRQALKIASWDSGHSRRQKRLCEDSDHQLQRRILDPADS